MAESNPPRHSVFISYCHKDKRWKDDLSTHLKPYVRNGTIVAWCDDKIRPGEKWYEGIREALSTAKVAVLLVTPAFLSSDFIHNEELAPTLKEAETGGVKILWIPVSASSYKVTPIASYQSVISPEKPLEQMKAERNAVWVRICEAIATALTS